MILDRLTELLRSKWRGYQEASTRHLWGMNSCPWSFSRRLAEDDLNSADLFLPRESIISQLRNIVTRILVSNSQHGCNFQSVLIEFTTNLCFFSCLSPCFNKDQNLVLLPVFTAMFYPYISIISLIPAPVIFSSSSPWWFLYSIFSFSHFPKPKRHSTTECGQLQVSATRETMTYSTLVFFCPL